MILGETIAHIDSSTLVSAGPISLTAIGAGAINATVAALSASLAVGGTAGVGASLGAALAQNLIGYSSPSAAATPLEVEAYITGSTVTSGGALTQSATNSSSINVNVVAGSAAVTAGGTAGVGLSGAGVSAINSISAATLAYIDGGGGITVVSIALTALNSSAIDTVAGAASLAAAFGGTVGVAISIGVALAQNTITNDVEARITNDSAVVTTGSAGISLSATNSATIDAVTAAASVAVSLAGTVGAGISGAGAEAQNVILGQTTAHIDSSTVHAVGPISTSATETGSITATVAAASAAVAGGGVAGVGASLGAALAQNLIGYSSTSAAATPLQVEAYVNGSTVVAGGALTQGATDTASITATVASGSVAVTGGGTAGVGLSGAGASVVNQIATDIETLIENAATVYANSVGQTASDNSNISVTSGTASIAAGFGTVGVAVSVSADTATNTIDNQVLANISGASTVVTGAEFTNASGIQALAAGDTVMLGNPYPTSASYTALGTGTQVHNLAPGTIVRLDPGYLSTPLTVASSTATNLNDGDRIATDTSVYVWEGAAGTSVTPDTATFTGTNWVLANGVAGAAYEFIGTTAQGNGLDLNAQKYENTSLWQLVGGTSGITYMYTGSAQTLPLGGLNYGDTSAWQPVSSFGGVSSSSSETATISATAAAASAAAAGGLVGISLSASGALAENVIGTDVLATITGSTVTSGAGVSLRLPARRASRRRSSRPRLRLAPGALRAPSRSDSPLRRT